jgi:hypothetical protein
LEVIFDIEIWLNQLSACFFSITVFGKHGVE